MPPPVDDDHLSALFRALGSVDRLAPEALSRLESFVRTADDYELFRVNPIQYGAAQDLSETQAIELFVHAAKVGLFEMDWLLICAYCPQVAGSFRDLDQLHPRFRCAFCNAVNDVGLDDYIQVAFTISRGVRDIVFHRPEELTVEDFYLRYNFSKGFIAPFGMNSPTACRRAVSRLCRYRRPCGWQLRIRSHGRPFRGA